MAALVSPFLCSPGFNVKFPSFSSANRRLSFSNESVHVRSPSTGRYSMFIGAKPVMKDGNLSFNGKDIVTDVPRNIVVTPFTDSSAFLGATSDHSSSRHIFKLGIIQGVRLLCLFRFKIFWMIPRVGNAGSDIPVETQMLLLEATEELSDGAFDGSISYVVLLPLLDGEFRSSLQGNSANEIEICVESGDPSIVTSQPLKAVFVNCGENPFELMKESMKILEKYTGTFTHRESKQMPGIMDWLGWCTWDAFYHDVNPQGIKEGLKRLYEGGTPAKFLIIDDGWQDTSNDFQKEGEPFVDGTQFGGRLLSIKENSKFQKTEKGCSSLTPGGLKDFVSDIKSTFGLKYVYVWHALLGYWGGLNPEAPGTKKYSPKMSYPEQSPGNLANMRDLSMDSMEKYGIGVLDPARVSEFYDDLHGYLVSQGVDGVKVDAQNILETISNGLGGRVSLTRHFQQSLEKSIASNFPENSIICCMGLSTDSIYHLKKSAITRASDDYYPRNPKTQGTHVAAVAFNSIFLGEVVVPDWDMFYSRHSAAEFHAVARAVGGCAVYVSDKPGQHDFKVLKRLVLPDGSVLRAKFPGRPSRDCLFVDPVMDGKSLLKIWNLNKFSGVIGVFNCQGTGSWPCTDDTVEKHASSVIAGQVSPADIEYFEEVSGELWTEECAIFSFQTGLLSRMSKEDSFTVELDVLQCNVFTVSPIKLYIEKIEFAPVGLIDMYNSGGAIEAVEFCNENGDNEMHIKGRGSGRFGAYSSATPKLVRVNSNREEFTFNADDHFLIMAIPSEQNYWEIVISY